MGMNHAGELAALTRLVRPHVAIVTASLAHREFFDSERR
jgi:UDP-N-acetylmuramoyl-tripeptide--D-alanyl-D-alanine ligase